MRHKHKFPKTVKTLVYCGPTIPNVVRECTAFQGTIPQVVRDCAERCPPVAALIVDLQDFPQTRRAVRTKGTAMHEYYNLVNNFIKEV